MYVAIRECGIDGIWREPQCMVSIEFTDTLDQVSIIVIVGFNLLLLLLSFIRSNSPQGKVSQHYLILLFDQRGICH